MKFKKLCLCFLFLFYVNFTYADIRLPGVLGDHMVLQQKSSTNLWGWAGPGEKIFITTSWDNKTDSVVTDRNAKWIKNINTPVAGGPYTITLKGWNTITLQDIMIGEVWLCSGQSNMEWSSNNNLKQILDEIPTSANNNIRLFQVNKTTSAFPQDDIHASWKVCGPESLKGFSAIGYFFAKQLQEKLGVAVGVINSSWGGTPAEAWTPEEVVKNNQSLLEAAGKLNETPWWPIKPGLAYNAMIYPLINHSIAGTIWYQGESNTGTAATYQPLFTSMIQDWRKFWKKDFPFYYVQIAPYTYGDNHVGALLREQQQKTLSLDGTGMVVITDLVDNIKDIHPTNKKDVALRLANLALAKNYKQEGITAFASPYFEKMEIEKGKANLYFSNAPNGFMLKEGKKATEFYIAGSDQKFLPAEVKLEKDKIIVWNKAVKEPVAVRFAFSNTAMSNVFSKEGLPVAPFRTDDWPADQ